MSLLQLLALQIPQLQPSSNVPWAFLIQTDSACLNCNEEMRKAECGTVWEPQHSHTGPSTQRHPQWVSSPVEFLTDHVNRGPSHHGEDVRDNAVVILHCSTRWSWQKPQHWGEQKKHLHGLVSSLWLPSSSRTQAGCHTDPELPGTTDTDQRISKEEQDEPEEHTYSLCAHGNPGNAPRQRLVHPEDPNSRASSAGQRIRDTHLKKSRFMFWPEKKDCLNEGLKSHLC